MTEIGGSGSIGQAHTSEQSVSYSLREAEGPSRSLYVRSLSFMTVLGSCGWLTRAGHSCGSVCTAEQATMGSAALHSSQCDMTDVGVGVRELLAAVAAADALPLLNALAVTVHPRALQVVPLMQRVCGTTQTAALTHQATALEARGAHALELKNTFSITTKYVTLLNMCRE